MAAKAKAEPGIAYFFHGTKKQLENEFHAENISSWLSFFNSNKPTQEQLIGTIVDVGTKGSRSEVIGVKGTDSRKVVLVVKQLDSSDVSAFKEVRVFEVTPIAHSDETEETDEPAADATQQVLTELVGVVEEAIAPVEEAPIEPITVEPVATEPTPEPPVDEKPKPVDGKPKDAIRELDFYGHYAIRIFENNDGYFASVRSYEDDSLKYTTTTIAASPQDEANKDIGSEARLEALRWCYQQHPLTQTTANTMAELNPELLVYHYLNSTIYGADEGVDDLVTAISNSGWIAPLRVTSKGAIVHGNRRVRSAIILGIESVSAEVVEYSSEVDEVRDLVNGNNARIRTLAQQYFEIRTYARLLQQASPKNKSGKPTLKLRNSLEQAVETFGIKGMSLRTVDRCMGIMNRLEHEDVPKTLYRLGTEIMNASALQASFLVSGDPKWHKSDRESYQSEYWLMMKIAQAMLGKITVQEDLDPDTGKVRLVEVEIDSDAVESGKLYKKFQEVYQPIFYMMFGHEDKEGNEIHHFGYYAEQAEKLKQASNTLKDNSLTNVVPPKPPTPPETGDDEGGEYNFNPNLDLSGAGNDGSTGGDEDIVFKAPETPDSLFLDRYPHYREASAAIDQKRISVEDQYQMPPDVADTLRIWLNIERVDLDPCSLPIAKNKGMRVDPQVVKAAKSYDGLTDDRDGLKAPWKGIVATSIPTSSEQVVRSWIEKAAIEATSDDVDMIAMHICDRRTWLTSKHVKMLLLSKPTAIAYLPVDKANPVTELAKSRGYSVEIEKSTALQSVMLLFTMNEDRLRGFTDAFRDRGYPVVATANGMSLLMANSQKPKTFGDAQSA